MLIFYLWLALVLLIRTESFFYCVFFVISFFFFQAEDGIRDLVRSRGLGDVYKRQVVGMVRRRPVDQLISQPTPCAPSSPRHDTADERISCLLYTSDAADERSSVDLGGRRILKKKTKKKKNKNRKKIKKIKHNTIKQDTQWTKTESTNSTRIRTES